jgi:glutamyl-tRNA reductase
MNLILVGTNHRYSDIRTREGLSFSKNDISLALSSLIAEGIAKGAVILSTCQRVEIYAEGTAAGNIKRFFLRFKEVSLSRAGYLYTKEGAVAAKHLFSVAAGLDSEIPGEVEILNQVREAYLGSKSHGTTTPFLGRLFERAIFTGKLIRKVTGLLISSPSVAASAVERAEKISGLKKKRIFIIGSGVIAGKVAALASGKGAECAIVAGRTFEKAETLARRIRGKPVRFDEFRSSLNDADIIFSATASRHLILRKEEFEKRRTLKNKLVIFDLAFPRDIDTAIGALGGVELFNLDDFREEALVKNARINNANRLVEEKFARFLEKENRIWRSKSAQGQALLR